MTRYSLSIVELPSALLCYGLKTFKNAKNKRCSFLKLFFGSYIIFKKNQYLDKQLKKIYFDIIDIMFYFVQTIVEAFNQLRLCVVSLLLFVCLFGLFLKRFFFLEEVGHVMYSKGYRTSDQLPAEFFRFHE